MLHDMHDREYQSPMKSIEELIPKFKRKKNDTDLYRVLYWVGLAITSILMVVYFISMYFTYFDDPKEFRKMVSNRGWKTSSSVNLERQRIRDQKMREEQFNDRFAAPTKTSVYKEVAGPARKKRVDAKND